MGWVIITIIALMLIGSVAIVVVSRREDIKREERQRRFELQDSDDRVPLVGLTDHTPRNRPLTEETANFISLAPSGTANHLADTGIDPDPPAPIVVTSDESNGSTGQLGRLVNTIDGETILTTPPFALRPAVFSKRHGRYAASLMKRIPPWLVIAPRVRLDTLLTPTPPDGRDAEDWRNWRRRVRLRSIDLVLCDRRSWQPMLAILFERHDGHESRATEIAGGRDRMTDEVLAHVGLPFVRATGRFKHDWHAIRPYVEQAMLPSTLDVGLDDDDSLGGTGWDASAVVNLLHADDEHGWRLE